MCARCTADVLGGAVGWGSPGRVRVFLLPCKKSEGNVCSGGLLQGRLATWMYEAFAPLFHFLIKPIKFIALPSVQ